MANNVHPGIKNEIDIDAIYVKNMDPRTYKGTKRIEDEKI